MNIGLDFGTTNTVVAYEEDGEIKYLEFADDDDTYENLEQYILPSAAYISIEEENGEKYEHAYIGKKAFANRFSKKGTYISSIKKELLNGGEKKLYQLVSADSNGEKTYSKYTPMDITERILVKIFLELCRQFKNESVFNIKFTVPVRYDQRYIDNLLFCIRNAHTYLNEERIESGLAPIELLTNSNSVLQEPIAAVIACKAYLQNTNNVMVIDLGGGTLDVAIVSYSGDEDRKMGICYEEGLNDCGGEQFDEALVKLIKEKIQSEGIAVSDYSESYEKIKIEARKIKEKLQVEKIDKVRIDLKRFDENWNKEIIIDDKDYREETLKLRKNICNVIKSVYDRFCRNGTQIDKVLIVGGMAREQFLYDFLVSDINYSEKAIVIPYKYSTELQGLVSKGAAIANRLKNNLLITNNIVSTIGILMEDNQYYTVFEPYTSISDLSKTIEFRTSEYCTHMTIRLIEFFGEFDSKSYILLAKGDIRINEKSDAVVCVEIKITNEHKINMRAYPKETEEEFECEITF